MYDYIDVLKEAKVGIVMIKEITPAIIQRTNLVMVSVIAE